MWGENYTGKYQKERGFRNQNEEHLLNIDGESIYFEIQVEYLLYRISQKLISC